jgi:hypothetical protein
MIFKVGPYPGTLLILLDISSQEQYLWYLGQHHTHENPDCSLTIDSASYGPVFSESESKTFISLINLSEFVWSVTASTWNHLLKATRAHSLVSAASIKQRRGGSCRPLAKAVSNNIFGHFPQMIYQQRSLVVPLAGLVGNRFLP